MLSTILTVACMVVPRKGHHIGANSKERLVQWPQETHRNLRRPDTGSSFLTLSLYMYLCIYIYTDVGTCIVVDRNVCIQHVCVHMQMLICTGTYAYI